jgi:hypothetical protein
MHSVNAASSQVAGTVLFGCKQCATQERGFAGWKASQIWICAIIEKLLD